MYHGTPAAGASSHFDVSLDVFRRQVDRLLKLKVSIVDFSASHDPALLRARRTHVCFTFDDGRRNNVAAFQHLAERDIRATAFLVRDWTLSGIGQFGAGGYLRVDAVRSLAGICAFGAHGATNRDLTTLSKPALEEELVASREFLQSTLGREIDSMTLPGGRGNPAVLRSAKECGYRLVGDSVFDVNTRAGASVRRAVVSWCDDEDFPARLALKSRAKWSVRRARRIVLDWARGAVGDGPVDGVVAAVKRSMAAKPLTRRRTIGSANPAALQAKTP
jgi:peptidoglycan/xylan/chitin deacetylase (PgdA/CDA1 family)